MRPPEGRVLEPERYRVGDVMDYGWRWRGRYFNGVHEVTIPERFETKAEAWAAAQVAMMATLEWRVYLAHAEYDDAVAELVEAAKAVVTATARLDQARAARLKVDLESIDQRNKVSA